MCSGLRSHRHLTRMGRRLHGKRQNPRYIRIKKPTKSQTHKTILYGIQKMKRGTTLEQTVSKAKLNKRQLFKNNQIYLSTSVPGHPSLLRIVEANGGEARIVSHTIKGRAKVLRADFLKTAENQILISSPLEDDKVLQGKFMDEINEGGLKGGMYSSEWIMRSVLRQEIVQDEDVRLQ